MPTLNISDEIADVLVAICDTHSPTTGLSPTEKMEVGLELLVNSYDASAEVEVSAEGSPISAAELKKTLEGVLDPDISTKFRMPTGESQLPEPPQLTIKEILERSPENPVILQAQQLPFWEDAVVLVFSQLKEEYWDNPKTIDLIQQASSTIQKRHDPAKMG